MDEGAAGIGIGRGLRRGDALDGAVAELLGMLRNLLLQDIGEHRRDGAAEAGRRAAEEADAGAAKDGRPGTAPFRPAEPEPALNPDDMKRALHGPLDHP